MGGGRYVEREEGDESVLTGHEKKASADTVVCVHVQVTDCNLAFFFLSFSLAL